MALSDVKRWAVGRAEVVRITEYESFGSTVDMMFPGKTRDLIDHIEWAKPDFITPEGEMLIAWQAFVVDLPGARIMVDTCIGNDRKRFFEIFNDLQTGFLEDLVAAGYPPESFDYVVCTHLHYDHVGWNTRLEDGVWVPTFPNARYLFGRVEWDVIQELAKAGDWHADHLPDAIQPIVDAGLAQFVETNHALSDEVWLEPTPGHTPGHASVRIRSEGQEAVITGDVMHTPVQASLPDEPCSFDHDAEEASHTRRAFLDRHARNGTLVIGSHFPNPTAGRFEPWNGVWRFATDN